MATERRFPILLKYEERKERPDYPRSVPWSFIAPHARQADLNHRQTLERLAQRGGLDPSEMLAIVTGQRLRDLEFGKEAFDADSKRLLVLLAEHEGDNDES